MRPNLVSSSYWFLINSNLNIHNPQPSNQKKIKEFREAINRIFLSRNILNFIEIKDEADQKVPKNELINEIRSEVTLEIGEKIGLLHAHVSITVYHRTTISLNVNGMGNFIRKEYGFSVYTSPPKIISDYSVQIKRYQFKQMKRIPKLKIISVVTDENGMSKNFFFQY